MSIEIGKPISMDEVPEPEIGDGRLSKWPSVLEHSILPDQVLPIKFSGIAAGYYARGVMRKEAKKLGERLLSIFDGETITFYFWVEPKDGKGAK